MEDRSDQIRTGAVRADETPRVRTVTASRPRSPVVVPGRHAARLAVPLACLAGLLVAACQPTVQVKAPDKPIVINLNVKIEQDVRVRLEKGVEEVLSENPEIF